MSRLLLILILAVVSCSKDSELTLLDLRPIDSTDAIARWRGGEFEHLGRIGATGTLRWIAPIDGRVVDRAITVRGERIITVQYREEDHELFAVYVRATSSHDGNELWATPLGLYGTFPTIEILGRSVEQVVDVLVHREAGDMLKRIDITSGELRADLPLDAHVSGVQYLRDNLVFHGRGTIFVDRANQVKRATTAWDGCVVADDYIFVERGLVVRWPRADSQHAVRQTVDLPQSWNTSGCLSYQGQLALVGFDGESAIVHFVSANENATLTLSGDLATSKFASTERRYSNLHGDVSRFVPFLVSDSDASGRSKIVLVDLKRREIAWTKSAGLSRDLFRVGTHWYVTSDRGADRTTVIDGETGARVTARIQGAAPIRPDAISNGVLWLHSASGVDVGRLDAVTLSLLSLPPSIRVEFDAEGEL